MGRKHRADDVDDRPAVDGDDDDDADDGADDDADDDADAVGHDDPWSRYCSDAGLAGARKW